MWRKISELLQENERLKRENEMMKKVVIQMRNFKPHDRALYHCFRQKGMNRAGVNRGCCKSHSIGFSAAFCSSPKYFLFFISSNQIPYEATVSFSFLFSSSSSLIFALNMAMVSR